MAEKISINDSKDAQFRWQIRPARQNQSKSTGALIILLLIAAMVYFTSMNIWWSLFSFLILVAALNRFFFTSRFVIDDRSIKASYPLGRKELEWQHVRRFNIDSNGGYLSTRKTRSRLDAYQGMHLYFDDQRDIIIAEIKSKLKFDQ